MAEVGRLILVFMAAVVMMALIVVGVVIFEPEHRAWFRKGQPDPEEPVAVTAVAEAIRTQEVGIENIDQTEQTV